MWSSKDVYYVSGSTGLLAEDFGKALLCQFQEISFNEEKIPFIKSQADARKALQHILERSGGVRPLVFCTIMDPRIKKVFDSPEVEFFDIFGNILDRLEDCLESKALRVPGYSRTVDELAMAKLVEAIHFSIEHDDGTKTREYDEAEVILVGVSRSGKTPVSVYLSTHMGIKAANFPLTEEHLNTYTLPSDILRNRGKVVGLMCTPNLLHKIREQRYGGSSYASLATCITELNQAREIFLRHTIPTVETDGKSIEETAVQVTQLVNIPRKKWRTI
ncbi:MAG: pyruvate, water dikinase regulatory protein [Desulfobulbaceae bacterium]